MLPKLLSVIILIKLCSIECIEEMDLLKKPIYLKSKVGSYAVFDCPLDFPQEIEMPYILHWNKEVINR